MAKRLGELYGVGTAVFILLNNEWQAGVVVAHQHPGIWVETADGRLLVRHQPAKDKEGDWRLEIGDWRLEITQSPISNLQSPQNYAP
ncbi:MAG: hypothetical protein HF973_12930 [Chloroflexi bacterium]|nr:hypothetical protein [Chloroflexota bacterium]